MPELEGCFVTGTDTGAGKTVVAAAIVATLRRREVPVAIRKPVLTGLDERPDPIWPPDHQLLAAVAGCDPSEVTLVEYGPPVSPHLAAELDERPIPPPAALAAALRNGVAPGAWTIVEGVGGLLVPFGPNGDVRALARELALPLVIAARPGLGTINHTLLTLEAARSAGLAVAGVVLTPWPAHPDQIAVSNRQTIARLGAVQVATLAEVQRPTVAELADAAAVIPVERWLGRSGAGGTR